MYCYQSVKDRKFESNSQHTPLFGNITPTVISLSKIENLKAIYNTAGIRRNENMKQESETGKSNRDLAMKKAKSRFHCLYDEDAKAGYFFMTSS